MRNRPTGDELLAIARQTIKEELLPHLPKDKVYDALMIMNAMGIAARQIEYGESPQVVELGALDDLLGEEFQGLTLEGQLQEANQVLAERIRKGEFDPGSDAFEQLFPTLWQNALQTVRESAPKYLDPLGLQ